MSARLARTLLLAAAFLVAASAESSSSSSTERVLSDVTKEKPPPRLRRRLKDRGVLEGEFSDDATMITADHRKPGQEEGAFTGRNPKNLKHRRLHAVEVEERKLREANYVNKEGTADFAGIVKLAKAEQDRVRGRQHQTHLTMEDLDTMYPTPEGDVRRGIAPPLEQQKNVTVEINPDRWARRSHFVEMGKPGERKSVFPEEMLNYRTTSEEMVVFVEGSLGHRYAITLQDDSSVGDLKKLVWADEREARWKIGGLQDKDKAAGFDLTEQLLFIDDIILEPDSRPLERFNVTDYKIVRVRPPSRPFTADEIDELAEHYDEMVYWRERDKAVMIEPDSDDDDSTYRMVKKMWKEASDQNHAELTSQHMGFSEYQEMRLKEDPNIGFRPHEAMDEDYAKGVKKELEHIGSQAFWDEVGDESKGMHEEVQQTATEPGQKSSVECFYKESDSQEDKEEGEVDVDEAAKFFGGYEHLERCGITIQDGGPGGGGGRKGAAADRSARDGVNDGRGEAFEIPEDLIKRVTEVRQQMRAEKHERFKQHPAAGDAKAGENEVGSGIGPITFDD